MAFVYRYIAGDKPVYIGRASDLHARISAHRCDEWFSPQLGIEYIEVPSDSDADIIETYLISELQPKYNRAKRWKKPALQIDLSTYHWTPYIKPMPTGFLKPKQEDTWICQTCGRRCLERNTYYVSTEIRGSRLYSHEDRRICKDCLLQSDEYAAMEARSETARRRFENDPNVIWIK